ncbi:Na+/H+ antiporter subunit E [Deinococcus yavapaiensis]|uniref:Multicomponent Na+:H+ antiporter subunit E n=1 Tax=Deinococcus yavapaiensis KR-236 TaxID=694435 RepID=A0A318SAY1_9DEIO|nr:Na+/H+ antiporter subunit E [Deinococcus yavapaiensis]PYE56539.1 multicomponent Na+:H+ antiporter subunit E [Deinococcus yavapaiensis KR-236]
MRSFAIHVLLSVAWALFLGSVDLPNLAVGFVLGFAALVVFRRVLPTDTYIPRVLSVLGFLGYFVKELVVANVQVASFALKPEIALTPVIVAVPLRVESDAAIATLAATITLLPGTVAMGVSDDRRTLYAHAIGLPTLDAARASISAVEDRLLKFMR